LSLLEDGYAADAAATAQHRANQQRILNAETMATAVTELRPSLRPERGLLDEAWRNTLLLDEHTWTWVGATTQPESDENNIQLAQKTATATHAGEQIEQSVQRSWAQLEPLLAQPQAAIAVWNRLNWQRDQWTETDLCPGQILLDPDTQKPLPQLVLGQEAGTQLPASAASRNECASMRREFHPLAGGSFPLPRRQCPESGRNSTATQLRTRTTNWCLRLTPQA